MCSLSLQKLESYYHQEPKETEKAILAFLSDSSSSNKIVYGTRAVNAYLPEWLDRDTKDWDIFVDDKAEGYAKELEEKLDKKYGGDFFYVQPALHPGTFRVKSKVTGETVADISLKDREVAFNRIKGINYASEEFLEEDSEEILRNPLAIFRHNKAQDNLQRFKVNKAAKKKKKKSRKGDIGGSLSSVMRYP